MAAVVPIFGKADPEDYMDPLCHCGHQKAEHEPQEDTTDYGHKTACWHGWTVEGEGCQCEEFADRRNVRL